MPQPPSEADVELARELLALWDSGDGTSKSQPGAPDLGGRIFPRPQIRSVRFHANLHAQVSRTLGKRPGRDEPEARLDIKYAEYITSFKRYLYSQAWIDLLVDRLSTPEAFADLTGVPPVQLATT